MARVIRRPAISLAAGVILLLAAAVPVLGLNIGSAGISTLPDDLAAKQGYLALQRSFPAASAEPAQIVIDGSVSSPDVRGAIERLEGRLAGDPRFGRTSLQVNPAGDLGVLSVPLVVRGARRIFKQLAASHYSCHGERGPIELVVERLHPSDLSAAHLLRPGHLGQDCGRYGVQPTA